MCHPTQASGDAASALQEAAKSAATGEEGGSGGAKVHVFQVRLAVCGGSC